MGLTTQYLRYVPGSVFGLVGTSRCIRYVTRFSQTNKYVATAACEKVVVWDLKRGTKLFTFDADVNGTVTVIEVKPPCPGSLDNTHIAAGYSDGTVVVFDISQSSMPLKFSGHRNAISTLAWNDVGMLASGSVDGELVVWDVGSERGMVRFKGHKGCITRVRFLQTHNVLVSSGKDLLIKFWDLDTNHCFRTLADHTKEVWDFVTLKKDSLLITGSSDELLRVWRMTFRRDDDKLGTEQNNPLPEQPTKLLRLEDGKAILESEEDQISDDASFLKLEHVGNIERSRNDRVCGLMTDGRVLACYSKGKAVEFYGVLSEEQTRNKLVKRLKRERKRDRESGSDVAAAVHEKVQLVDEIRKFPILYTMSKLSGVDVMMGSGEMICLVGLHSNNSVAMYTIDPADHKETDRSKTAPKMIIDNAGHRSEIRAVNFNSLSDQVFTASGDSIKVWNRSAGESIMSMPSEYVVSMVVVPGDRHVIVGTLSGRIQLFDIGSGTLLEDVEAHQCDSTQTDTGVWGLTITSDGRGFVSGGSDSLVHFWKFELVRDSDDNQGRRLSFIQDQRALKVADQVVALKCSSTGKFLAVATLDLKETIYYMDSLKLCNELYGKSLPATCLDFSVDEDIICVGSKDTCIRIFGTDFGDQRRLMKNAHQGGVTALQFISKTHLFFSAGHDGCVKQWDADNFQQITTLKGHIGIIRCLAVCPKGAWVATCGQDYSIRLWDRTQEPLVLEDEREEERRQEEEEAGITATQRPVVSGEDVPGHAVRPSVSSHLTDEAADRIIEALDIYEEQVVLGSRAIAHQLMTLVYKTNDPHKFLLEVLRKVKSTELEEAILLLPLDYIIKLLKASKTILQRNWDVELIGRIIIVSMRVNMSQLLASSKASSIIRELSIILPDSSQQLQDTVGYNLAGLYHMKTQIEQRSEVQLFAEATQRTKDSKKKRKKKLNATKRAALLVV